MIALLFLIGAALVGSNIVRRNLGEWLNAVEQILWGIVTGWMLSVWCAYLVSRSLGQLQLWAMVALLIGLWTAACGLWWSSLMRLRQQRRVHFKIWQAEYKPLVILLAVCAVVYWYFFSMRMFRPEVDGLYSGGNSWNDMALHIALATSFLYGQNFPPVYTPLYAANAVEPLRYPFLPDFHTAVLMKLGAGAWGALMMTAVPLALIITALLYFLARRITKRDAAAVLACVLFLLNGGLGFLYFFEDWRASHQPFRDFFAHLEQNYANMWDRQIHWANVIVDSFLPHRASLYGIPVALMAFTAFAMLWERWHASDNQAETKQHFMRSTKKRKAKTDVADDASMESLDEWNGWRLLLFTGVLTGLLPMFHAHSYMAIGLVSGFLFLLRPRRVWLAFWLPAVVLAIPQLAGTAGEVAQGRFMYVQLNWKGNTETSWLLYWLRNIGVPLLLLVPAWIEAPRPWRSFYGAFACLMIFCLIVMVSPHDYDNIKIMYYWYALSCVLVAWWLVDLAVKRQQKFLAALLVILSTVTGLLALQRERLIHWRIFSTEEMQTAEFVRDHTAPRALFLTAPIHNQPVLCLAGRPILMGYGGWLWTHGYQFQQRETDVKAIYAGAPNAAQLLARYGVDYVYLSDRERTDMRANIAFFESNFPRVYQNADINIYDARRRIANALPPQ